MNGVLVMRTVQVKPVKADEANLTEHGERRDKEGEREGGNLKRGERLSREQRRLSLPSLVVPPRTLRNGSDKNQTIRVKWILISVLRFSL